MTSSRRTPSVGAASSPRSSAAPPVAARWSRYRPGRAIIGGVALAVLLVAGAAIAGRLLAAYPGQLARRRHRDRQGERQQLRHHRERRPAPVDRPGLGAADLRRRTRGPQTVAQDEINKVEIGDDIGIFGAPDSLPSTEPAGRHRLERLHERRGRRAVPHRPAARPPSPPRRPRSPSRAATAGATWSPRRATGPAPTGSHLGSGRRANGILARAGARLRAGRTRCPTSGSTCSRRARRCPWPASGSPASVSPRRTPTGSATRHWRSAQLVSYVGKTYVLVTPDARSRSRRSRPRSTRSSPARRRSRSTPSTLRADAATDLEVWPAAEPVALAAEPCAVLDAAEGRASRTLLRHLADR